MPKSLFTYRALTPEKSRIRLVRLKEDVTRYHAVEPHSQLKDSPNSDRRTSIECKILHVTLEQAPPFAALSYVWGDTRLESVVLLNGIPTCTTRNLAVALRHLEGRVEEQYLWVDALCIDQGNEVEKTEQVRQMHHIYSRAARVIAWIGAEEQESDRAMRWMQRHGRIAHDIGIGSKPELQFRTLLHNHSTYQYGMPLGPAEIFVADIARQMLMETPEDGAIFLALVNLLKRPIWNRLWIVQEIVHGRKVSFWCGDCVLEEEDLHHSLRLMRNAQRFHNVSGAELAMKEGNKAELPQIDSRNAVNLLKIRRARQLFPLIYLIRTLRFFDCTDPRDRIFALVNCASDAELLHLRPDYGIPCERAYRDAAVALLINGYFDIIALCNPPRNTMKLPSWAPDLTVRSKVSPLQQRALLRQTGPMRTELQPDFHASSDLLATGITAEGIEDGTPTLILRAVIVGIVERVGHLWENHTAGAWLSEFKDTIAQSEVSDTSEQLAMICRTAVADQEIRQGNRKPRLSKNLLQKVVKLLEAVNLASISSQDFHRSGIGEYLYQMTDIALERRPFWTSNGHLGVGPAEIQPHDVVYILSGSRVPHILRPAPGDALSMIGEAFAHGVMDGEAAYNREDWHTIRII